jgi:hypothetical protein
MNKTEEELNLIEETIIDFIMWEKQGQMSYSRKDAKDYLSVYMEMKREK